MKELVFTVVIIAVFAGCGRSDRASYNGSTVRDSAGIRIVESVAPRWSSDGGWRLDDVPEVDIGSASGAEAYQLFRVSGAVRLSDGRIVVANAGSNELRFYDAAGAHVRSAGRPGDGPGEFRSIVDLSRGEADSLFIYDFLHRRMSIYSPGGELAGSFRVPVVVEGTVSQPVGFFRDGSLLIRASGMFMPGAVPDGITSDSVSYFRLTRAGEVIDSLGTFPGPQGYARTLEGRLVINSLPFGLVTASVAHDDAFYFGSGASYEVAMYSPSGELRRLLRLPARQNPPVTPADVERLKENWLESASPERRRQLERIFTDLPFPASMPAFASLKVDPEGNVWLADFLPPGVGQERWRVFDQEGRLLGSVDMPERFRILEIGGDYVLGTWQDDLGVERVQLYRLLKRREGEVPPASTIAR